LKRQARELRQAYLDGDDASRATVEGYRPLLSGDAASLTLTDAKLVIAREYGFEGWPKLKHHVESLRGNYEELDDFMGLVADGKTDQAKSVMDHYFAVSAVRSGIQIGIHAAARLDLIERLTMLLDQDPSLVHARNEAGLTPLHLAGGDTTRQALVHHFGADPNALDGRFEATPLQWAVADQRPMVAHGLLHEDARADAIVLCVLGLLEPLREILRQYPEFRGVFDVTNLPGGGVYERVYGARTSLLHVAARLGGTTVAGSSLDVGENIEACDSSGETPLLLAVSRYKNAEMVELLLSKGASVSATNPLGKSALHLAAHGGHMDAVMLLLAHGAQIEAVDDAGGTALNEAVGTALTHHSADRRSKAVHVARALLEAGASAENIRQPTGREDLDEVLKAVSS
jgi:ankyrin repeat protein